MLRNVCVRVGVRYVECLISRGACTETLDQ